MRLEDYFDFLAPDDIRIKGSRIGIESVLGQFLHAGLTPGQIAERYHTITLEDVYATILFYLHNKEDVSAYMDDYWRWQQEAREESLKNPTPTIAKMMEWLKERENKETAND